MSASARALAALLPAIAVSPAPPGDALVVALEPRQVVGVIGEPSRQVMICTPAKLSVGGPAEPDAAGAATSGFVTGVAQVDQYAVVYSDTAAAERAVGRARARAEDCEAAFAVHTAVADAEAIVSAAPSGVDGFLVRADYDYACEPTDCVADEVSAVLRSGATVLYIRANETGAAADRGWPTDGELDPDWCDQLVAAAAENLVR